MSNLLNEQFTLALRISSIAGRLRNRVWSTGVRDSSVGLATHYALDGPGIVSPVGARFSEPVQTYRGVHPISYTMRTWSFPRVKRPGRAAGHPPPSSVELSNGL